jgi:DNA-binding winged helix-turn-helix (wHTH) protein
MAQDNRPARLRFASFELDVRTGELRKNDQRIRLQDQPAKLLVLLAGRPGELVTRSDIQKALWGEDRFVEFEHAINTAIKKIREALGDDHGEPKIIETLPRKGYRFIATVEEVHDPVSEQKIAPSLTSPEQEEHFALPLPLSISRLLFVFIQVGYLAMYCVALVYNESLDDVLRHAGLTPLSVTFPLVIISAMCGIAVRLYLMSAVGWGHPNGGRQFHYLFPVLLVLDALWAIAPLLTVRALGLGIALAGTAGLAYVPFAQRTLVRSIYKI